MSRSAGCNVMPPPPQCYAATSDEALHSYPATRFGRNRPPGSIHPTIGSDLTAGNFAQRIRQAKPH